MILYPGLTPGLVVIVLAYHSDNPRSSPDWESNLDFVFETLILHLQIMRLWEYSRSQTECLFNTLKILNDTMK